ncbi:hypothetical protein [Caulifigura coniformis]|uniref:hypothetical protein n=1 Tax=Caulifigura coniformis TaxID=2527983 RepID=UPI0011A25E1F|nr:hypothetical protein [Caulifigura coniformis]
MLPEPHDLARDVRASAVPVERALAGADVLEVQEVLRVLEALVVWDAPAAAAVAREVRPPD